MSIYPTKKKISLNEIESYNKNETYYQNKNSTQSADKFFKTTDYQKVKFKK